jgi:uncharacterized protein with von Willebrand factor type A (vWA) domain
MNKFPLAPFLDGLSFEGFQVSMSDYRRISLALGAGGTWTVRRLRMVLCALLVRGPEQEKLFESRFDRFFNADLLTDIGPPGIDLERCLQHLERLRTLTPSGPAESVPVVRWSAARAPRRATIAVTTARTRRRAAWTRGAAAAHACAIPPRRNFFGRRA